jgi:hypothetical protein
MNLLTRRTLVLILTIVASSGVSQAAEPPLRRSAGQEVWARTEPYFGTNSPRGEVSDKDFAGFVDSEIAPRFPDGLTLLTGAGQHLDSKGVLQKERSKLLILFYPGSARDANRLIQEIRDRYKCRFEQESVLRVDSYVVVSF